MPEKAANWVLGWKNPRVQWWLWILIIGGFLGILIFWGIDGLNVNKSSFEEDFVKLKISNSEILPQISTGLNLNLSDVSVEVKPYLESSQPLDLFTNQTLEISDSSPNLVTGDKSVVNSVNLTWISSEFEPNYSSNVLAKWLNPGGEPCRDSRTVDIKLFGFGNGSRKSELSAGEIHEFVFQAIDESGSPHCLGGDYFEIDLSGEKWKSRPPVKDIGNGSYVFSVQVHPDFAGDYNLTIILLFRHYEGLKFSPTRFVFDKILRVVAVKFVDTSLLRLPEIRHCERPDYFRDVWSGRWTRHARNDSCDIGKDGRYRCQESSFPCARPWCEGPLGSLESNGWVYSAHCSFTMFKSEDAWRCLNGRWIFWWGDSNHCDTIRNILNFVLGVHDIAAVPRIFDMNITNPRDSSQVVRFTSIFNGHPNHTGNYQGLNSLINAEYRELLKGYFSTPVVPDTVVMNSGLHDGVFWPNVRRFVKGADYAAAFWAEVMDGVRKRGVKPPEVIYRTTVTTGGHARSLAFNPQKMEVFNGVVLDKLRQYRVLDRVIDDFDMTFPWHYDNRCNDGVHYGRAPLKMKWRDGKIGHQYFVDLMLCHVLINALCVGSG